MTSVRWPLLALVLLVLCVSLDPAVAVSPSRFHPRKPTNLAPQHVLALYQLMKDVHELFVVNNITYFIEGGSLIGAIRHKGIIPWDNDIDIQIFMSDVPKLLALRPQLKAMNHSLRRFAFGYKVTSTPDKIFPFIDVFPDRFVHNHTYFAQDSARPGHGYFNQHRCWLYRDDIWPLRTYQFGALKVFGPNRPEEFLDRCFDYAGGDWRKTAKQQNPDHVGAHRIRTTLTQMHTPAQPFGPLVDHVPAYSEASIPQAIENAELLHRSHINDYNETVNKSVESGASDADDEDVVNPLINGPTGESLSESDGGSDSRSVLNLPPVGVTPSHRRATAASAAVHLDEDSSAHHDMQVVQLPLPPVLANDNNTSHETHHHWDEH